MKSKSSLIVSLVLGATLLNGVAFAGSQGVTDKGKTVQQAAHASPKQSLININTASADQLTGLPHIGPKMAQRIINYRKQHGDFKSLDDLVQVKGIGTGRLKQIKGLASAS